MEMKEFRKKIGTVLLTLIIAATSLVPETAVAGEDLFTGEALSGYGSEEYPELSVAVARIL